MSEDEAVAACLVCKRLLYPNRSISAIPSHTSAHTSVPFLRRSSTLPLRPVGLLLLIHRNRRRSLAIQRRNFARNALYMNKVSQTPSVLRFLLHARPETYVFSLQVPQASPVSDLRPSVHPRSWAVRAYRAHRDRTPSRSSCVSIR
jgi:hypothetical protein